MRNYASKPLDRKGLNRLTKLHDFVKAHVMPKYFDMSTFRGDDQDNQPDVNACTIKEKSCGTTGCLMGWTPFAMPGTFKREGLLPKSKKADVNWGKASKTLFGIRPSNDPRWHYLFEGDWSYVTSDRKKQKKHALKRIKNLVESKGVLTEEMKKEMDEYNIYYPGRTDSDY